MYSWLSRCSIERGPDPWYNWGGPAKVGARKSFLFTESSLVAKTKNTWLILLSDLILHHSASMLDTVAKCHNQLSKV